MGRRTPIYRRALPIRQRLSQRYPNDAIRLRYVMVSCNNIGDVLVKQGNNAEALDYYRQGLESAVRLFKRDPRNAQAKRDLMICQGNVADRVRDQGRFDTALSLAQEARRIARMLSASDPGNKIAADDLSAAEERIAEILSRLGKLEPAFESYQRVIAMRQRFQMDQSSPESRRDLCNSFIQLAKLAFRLASATQPALERNYRKTEGSRALQRARLLGEEIRHSARSLEQWRPSTRLR